MLLSVPFPISRAHGGRLTSMGRHAHRFSVPLFFLSPSFRSRDRLYLSLFIGLSAWLFLRFPMHYLDRLLVTTLIYIPLRFMQACTTDVATSRSNRPASVPPSDRFFTHRSLYATNTSVRKSLHTWNVEKTTRRSIFHREISISFHSVAKYRLILSCCSLKI